MTNDSGPAAEWARIQLARDQGYPHLERSVVQLLDLPKEERIQRIKVVRPYLSTSQYQCLRELEFRIGYPVRKRVPNLRIEGASGLGKSTVYEAVIEKYPASAIVGSGVLSRPVVLIDLTGVYGRKELADALVKACGVPYAKRTPHEAIDAVAEALNKAGTRIVLLDEFADFMKAPDRERRAMVMLIKQLTNKLMCATAVAGGSDMSSLFTDEPHMDARFKTFKMEPWAFDEEFQNWLFRVVADIPLKKPSPIFDDNTRRQAIDRSGGNTERILIPLYFAAEEGIRTGTEVIDRKLFLGRI